METPAGTVAMLAPVAAVILAMAAGITFTAVLGAAFYLPALLLGARHILEAARSGSSRE